MASIANYNEPLPTCEGPKLRPFKHRKAAIEFRCLLSDDESGSGGHAHVFKVSIRSNVYALKVVRGPTQDLNIVDASCAATVQIL